VPKIRETLTSLDGGVPLANPRTMDSIVLRSMERTSLTMLLLVIAAGMSLLLSAVGLYGVVSYVVNQRRSEIGVRIALGARLTQVRGLVLGQSLRLALLGIAIGVLAALAAGRLLRSFLYGVGPADPLTLTVVSLLLVGVAAAASWIPAMRAARVQPMEVLRED
jgi:ABC-type antimicrobial peptide transport system permease subunit